MRKKNYLLLFAATVISCLIACSNLDNNTTVGQSVIKEYDPTLTEFEQNFYPLQFDTSIIPEAYSFPGEGNKGFGRYGGLLGAGIVNGNAVYSTVSFKIDSAYAYKFDSAKTLQSITIILDTLADSLHMSSDFKNDKPSLYLSDNEARFNATAPNGEPAVTLSTENDTSRFTGTANTLLQNNINSVFVRKDKIDSVFHLTLFTNTDTIHWYRASPKMVIHSISKTDPSNTLSDTIFGYTYLIATEDNATTEKLASVATSTSTAKRTAVFKLNLEPLWDSVKQSGFSEILATGIILKTDTIIADPKDSSADVSIRYLFSDKLLNNGTDFYKELTNHTDNGLSKSFNIGSIKDDSITIQVERQLQKVIEDKPSSFYLYLQVVSSNIFLTQEIRWKKPQVKVMLTTIR